jgi:hypothetical protein
MVTDFNLEIVISQMGSCDETDEKILRYLEYLELTFFCCFQVTEERTSLGRSIESRVNKFNQGNTTLMHPTALSNSQWTDDFDSGFVTSFGGKQVQALSK